MKQTLKIGKELNDIDSVILDGVEIQCNGIIRNSKGRLIGRLVDDVEYNSEHVKGLATQPQPIKEEECSACNNPLSKYIHTCKNHNKLNKELKHPIPSPQKESKDIEYPKALFLQYTDEWCVPRFKMTDEFKNWVKQVTDTLNSLTKRNIK